MRKGQHGAKWKGLTDDERFYRNAERMPNGCLKYGNYKKPAKLGQGMGYGLFWFQGKLWRANRYAYFRKFGHLPPKSKPFVLHTCHNAWCIEDSHLLEGTQDDNIQMLVAAGHHAHAGSGPLGERNGASKLNPEKVREIKKMLADKIPKLRIANLYGVTDTTILKIARGITWKEV